MSTSRKRPRLIETPLRDYQKMHTEDRSPMAAYPTSSSVSRLSTPSTWRGMEFEIEYTEEWMNRPSTMTERRPDGAAHPPWEWTSGWNDHHPPRLQEKSSSPSSITTTTLRTPSDTGHSHQSPMMVGKRMYGTWEDFFGPVPSLEDTRKMPWHMLTRPRRKSISEHSQDSVYSFFLDEIDAGPLSRELKAEYLDSQSSEDEELPQSALPGRNMAMNMATTMKAEFDLFRALAPPGLRDPLTLMDTVSKKSRGIEEDKW